MVGIAQSSPLMNAKSWRRVLPQRAAAIENFAVRPAADEQLAVHAQTRRFAERAIR
jgi:hypothetical protein